eukprot:TRINITY_DN8509_c0_g1_i2.p1 TRINITY_DN8509_c0_g1~~TRINITY_DN8509_c0_g1_i2.p1  ORF type:complete len:272 (+),score=41.16 TRINITY_DN8509_c0_g1_i2:15-830(+)
MQSCLEQQVDEVEIIMSMFSADEVALRDEWCLKESKRMLEAGYTPEEHPIISYSLLLTLKEPGTPVKLFVTYQTEYPNVSPRCYISILDSSVKFDFKRFNEELEEKLIEFQGCVCISNVIDWVETEGGNFILSNETRDGDKLIFVREWFWFHHLYSKVKRKLIVGWSDDLNLTGFSLAGKPGLACVEGTKEHVNEFSSRLRGLCWQKLSSRLVETVECSPEEFEKQRKFEKLYEWSVGSVGARGNHPDLGNLRLELEERGLKGTFETIFSL